MNQTRTSAKLSQFLRSYAMIIALAGIWIAFQIITEGTFLSIRNISNLFRQMAVVGILAVGMTVCLIAGNFDLSAGNVTGFLGAVSAFMITQKSMSPIVAIIAAILIGAVIGLWNGLWVAYAKIPAFIATLGSSLIFKGGLFIITQGTTIPVRSDLFLALGQQYIDKTISYIFGVLVFAFYVGFDIKRSLALKTILGSFQPMRKQILRYVLIGVTYGTFLVVLNSYEGVPVAVLVLLLLTAVISFVLKRTKFGREVYAVGGNERAAKMSGINNAKVTLLTFVIMGAFAGVAGVTQTARLAAATPGAASGMELDAIASSVIGGVSLAGGSGKVINSLIGALVMASLTNGMSLLNVNSDVQYIVKGLILMLAVWFDVKMRKTN